MRSETEIFGDLERLCTSSGYVHALAFLCLRDSLIPYSGEMKLADLLPSFSTERLIRTETTTLLGLLLKREIDFSLPAPEVLHRYLKQTDALLTELHQGMTEAIWKGLDWTSPAASGVSPFSRGEALREPIFYGGESAYNFQYRDFSVEKYSRDNPWLIEHKGFSIDDACAVVREVARLQDEKAVAAIESLRSIPADEWTLLPAHEFSAEEIADRVGLPVSVVERVLSAFAVESGTRNDAFRRLQDFNIATAAPLIRAPQGKFLLFHVYGLAAALYESPFYWMAEDKDYCATAMNHRGGFTERFAARRLTKVFGERSVFSNVDIFAPSGNKLGEIDVLVLYGDRAILLQAKSKRLTLEARRGNDLQIRSDFQKSIQDSCDQAFRCARLIEDGTRHLAKDAAGRAVVFPRKLNRIYVLCLVSDHYPALGLQAREFLEFEKLGNVSTPFVLDVFALDAMTEMLDSPLRLLSYVDRRSGYAERVMASHELTILSYHLKKNLWLDDEIDWLALEDDVSVDLDLAMLARREGIPAASTPDGILTRLRNTSLGRLVETIESVAHPAMIELGLVLLALGEEAAAGLSSGMEHIALRALTDGQPHDLSLILAGTQPVGLTIHCNNDPDETARRRLDAHCQVRKYRERAERWFGICIRPKDAALRFGGLFDYPWTQNDQMDGATSGMRPPENAMRLLKGLSGSVRKAKPNERCPCGSGKKFKKCCGS